MSTSRMMSLTSRAQVDAFNEYPSSRHLPDTSGTAGVAVGVAVRVGVVVRVRVGGHVAVGVRVSLGVGVGHNFPHPHKALFTAQSNSSPVAVWLPFRSSSGQAPTPPLPSAMFTPVTSSSTATE